MKKTYLFIFILLLITISFNISGCNENSDKSQTKEQQAISERFYLETQEENPVPNGYDIVRILYNTPDHRYILCSRSVAEDNHEHDEDHNEMDEADNAIFLVSRNNVKAIWNGNCLAAAMNSESEIYILVERVTDTGKSQEMLIYNIKSSNCERIGLKSPPKEHSVYVNNIFIFSDRMAIVREGGMQIFSLSGKLLFEKNYKNVCNSTSDGKNLYMTEYPIVGGETNRLFALDVLTFEEKWSSEIQLILDQIKLLEYNSIDSKLYMILNNYLMRYDDGKLTRICNLLEHKSGRIISNSMVSNDASDFSYYNQLLFQSDKSFSLLMYCKGSILFTYDLTDRVDSVQPANVIKALLPVHDVAMEMIAARFGDANSGVKVKFEYYKEKGDISQQDFVQFLNLKILSGDDSWDIVPILFLPYWQYMQKNVLADLDKLDSDGSLGNPDKYYVNIIDGCRVNNKLYYMPVNISFPSFLADTTSTKSDELMKLSESWSWQDLLDISRSWAEKDKLFIKDPFESESALLWMVCSPYIAGFFTGERKDKGRELFTECLSAISELESARLYADETQNGVMTPISNTQWFNFMNNSDSFFEKYRVIPVPIIKGDYRRSFNIQQAYAINARSSCPEAALEFLEYVAGDSTWQYPGAVVKADGEYIINNLSGYSGVLPEKVTPFVESLLAAKASLNHAQYFDQQVGTIVWSIIEQYRAKLITKEKASHDISERVWLYANE